MSLPFLLRKLFQNDGAGEKLNPAIIPTDTALSDTSTNPIANSVVKAAIDAKSFPVDSALSTTSTNAVQNSVVTAKFNGLASVATSGSYNDLSNKPTIPTQGLTLVASSSSTASWYRKYSDGWIEQGGYFHNSSRTATHTFSLAFKNTNISLVFGEAGAGGVNTTNSPHHAAAVSIETFTTTGFTVFTGDDDSFNAAWLFWYACGY